MNFLECLVIGTGEPSLTGPGFGPKFLIGRKQGIDLVWQRAGQMIARGFDWLTRLVCPHFVATSKRGPGFFCDKL